jgi:ABC-type cobalamin transport system permease subunit
MEKMQDRYKIVIQQFKDTFAFRNNRVLSIRGSYNYRRLCYFSIWSFEGQIWNTCSVLVAALPKHYWYYEPSKDLMRFILSERITKLVLVPNVLVVVISDYLV